MPSLCPACNAQVPDGAAFCAVCGAPQPLPSTTPTSPAEQWIGEIPQAFVITFGWGPVRIQFTDRRMVVLNFGEHSIIPRPSVYNNWKRSLPTEVRWRSRSEPWCIPAEPICWVFENWAIAAAHADVEHGIGVDRDCCQLTLLVWNHGIRFSPLGPSPEGWPQAHAPWMDFHWRVPGDPDGLTSFLRTMPFAPVVGKKSGDIFHRPMPMS